MEEPGTEADEAKAAFNERRKLHFRLLGVLYILLIVAALNYPRLARRWNVAHPVAHAEDAGVGHVNGVVVTTEEFFGGLQALAGEKVFNHIVVDKVIQQEAARQKLAVDESEVRSEVDRLGGKQDLHARTFLEDDVRARLLLGKLLLKDATEVQKHHIYDMFKPALMQYELFDLEVSTPAEARTAEAALAKGTSFTELATSHSEDLRTRSTGGRIGFVSRAAIIRAFDEKTATTLLHMKPGGLCTMVRPRRVVLVKLGSIRDSYDDLKPSIDALLTRAGSYALLHKLTHDAKVESPYSRGPAPVADESLAPLPGSHEVETAAPLPGNGEIHETLALPGNHEVESAAPLPGNGEIHETLALPGNKEVEHEASVLPGNPKVQQTLTLPGNKPVVAH